MEEKGLVTVESRFVRGRNALLCSADFGDLLMDFYLHFGQNGVVLNRGVDEKLKQLVAAVSLHVAASPRAVSCAWTMHFEEEGLNLFATAEGPAERVIGQAFDRNVRDVGGNILHSETMGENGVLRRSSVEFVGSDVLLAAEAYYVQSEQREGRYFYLGGDSFALLVAQPDCDLEWLRSVGVEEVRGMASDYSRPLMETRRFCFHCGCTPERIAGAIGPTLRGRLDEVFGGEDVIHVSCSRCGQRHELTKANFGEGA